MKIKYRRSLAPLFLGAGLGLGTALADDIPVPVPNPLNGITLFGSDQTLQYLEPFQETFKKLAGKDVLVISPSDLMTPVEQAKANILYRLGVPKSDSIDSLAVLAKIQAITDPHMVWNGNSPARYSFNSEWATDIINDSPFSVRQKEGTPCLVGGADPKLDARIMATNLAFLPSHYMLSLNITITADELHKQIMLHEARHCSHHPLSEEKDPVLRTVRRLEYEMDADDAALEEMKADYADQPGRYEKIKQDIKALRTLHLVRGGQPLTQGVAGYATHGGFFSDDDARPDAAEIIATAGILNLSSTMIGTFLPIFLKSSTDPLFQERFNSRDIFLSQNPAEDGKFILSRYPDFEYSIYRAASNVMEKYLRQTVLAEDEPLPPYIRLMKDYADAFEHLIPTIKDDPIAKIMEDLFDEEMIRQQVERTPVPFLFFKDETSSLPIPKDNLGLLRYGQQLKEDADLVEMERQHERLRQRQKDISEILKGGRTAAPQAAPSPPTPQ